MSRFFPGHDRATGMQDLDRAMIAAHNVTDFDPPSEGWMLDSGGFRMLVDHGRYEDTAAEYARYVDRLDEQIGGLVCAFQQDAPLTPAVADALPYTDSADDGTLTGPARHALLAKTIGRLRQARATSQSGVPIAPVLHGTTQAEYLAHARRLAWTVEPTFIGIGGLKAPKQDADGTPSPAWLRELCEQVLRIFPDVRLHALGVGKRYLLDSTSGPALRRLLWSYDSSAWKVRARYAGRNQNATDFATEYADDLEATTPLFT